MAEPVAWDIFCRVVDNYGDAGVCWRLARQLANERHARVRLWLDDLATLQALAPGIDPRLASQRACEVEVRRWTGQSDSPGVAGDVVIEVFGCGLPERHLDAMLARDPPPLWVTLEYLSAEAWVAQHHGLPSPHPRLPLNRYFYFPGFTAGTGGVLRERDLNARRAAFGAPERAQFWNEVGFAPPPEGTLVVSLFAYSGTPAEALLRCWERGGEPLVVAVAPGPAAERVRQYLALPQLAPGSAVQRGSLEVRLLPFVPQPRYDELLWSCDINFVRGEDSFVRAQWAERPFVWNIYPQEEGAHRLKLEAFLDLYAAGLESSCASALRGFWQVWNLTGIAPVNVHDAWRAFRSHAGALRAHAAIWAARMAETGDLATKLAQFCRDRVK